MLAQEAAAQKIKEMEEANRIEQEEAKALAQQVEAANKKLTEKLV